MLITIHATNSTPGMHLTGKDVNRRDRSNGYSKCGYHFVVSREGDVYEGRKLNESSIHDGDQAAEAISICLVGGCDYEGKPSDNFTLPQWETLRHVIRVIGQTNQLSSTCSKTPAVTSERVSQIVGLQDGGITLRGSRWKDEAAKVKIESTQTQAPPPNATSDESLALVMANWNALPEAVRVGIVAMVKSASCKARSIDTGKTLSVALASPNLA